MSAENNTNLLQLFKSGYKRSINKNDYSISKKVRMIFWLTHAWRLFIDYLHQCYKQSRERKCYNIIIDGKTFFEHPVRDKKQDNLRKIATRQGGDYATGTLLYVSCFNEHHKLTARNK